MKLSHLVCAAVLGTTLFATAQTASADRWYRGGGYVRHGWYAPRAYVRPYSYAPSYGYAPGYYAPAYNPYYVAPRPVVVTRPAVVVRPRPVIVHRGWYRRW
jgi:hypothetical protein